MSFVILSALVGACLAIIRVGMLRRSPDPRSGTGWIQTFTGRKVYPLGLVAEDVCIEDIAHALSMQCRFAGHTRFHYSVAQHSLLVASCVPDEDKLWALLHDSGETYLTDLPRPLKYLKLFAPFRMYEKLAMKAICEHFGLDPVEPPSVKLADKLLLVTEARDLMSPLHPEWHHRVENGYEAMPATIKKMTPEEVEQVFLTTYFHYTQTRQ